MLRFLGTLNPLQNYARALIILSCTTFPLGVVLALTLGGASLVDQGPAIIPSLAALAPKIVTSIVVCWHSLVHCSFSTLFNRKF